MTTTVFLPLPNLEAHPASLAEPLATNMGIGFDYNAKIADLYAKSKLADMYLHNATRDAIAKGTAKVCVTAWARGGKLIASHHVGCFVRGLRAEACSASRGQCKAGKASFVRGGLRLGYPTTAPGEMAWLCRESAALLLPPIIARELGWEPTQLRGVDELSEDLAADALRTVGRTDAL